MKSREFGFVLVYAVVILCSGCAALNTNLDSPVKSQLEGKRVVVFPFQDPYYKGRQIQGIGIPFATVFVTKLQTAGVLADGAKSNVFSTSTPIELEKACKYSLENNYDAFLVGTVTEWIDGATQWSGTVDVAALTVTVYRSTNCELAGSASGRQNGQFFTFREIFIAALGAVVNRYNWLCHAYCLKDNHYHLMIETPDAKLIISLFIYKIFSFDFFKEIC